MEAEYHEFLHEFEVFLLSKLLQVILFTDPLPAQNYIPHTMSDMMIVVVG